MGDDAVAVTLGVGLAVGDAVAVGIGQVVRPVPEPDGVAEPVTVDEADDGALVGAWISAVESSSDGVAAMVGEAIVGGASSMVAGTHNSPRVALAAADRAAPGTALAVLPAGACVVA
jgi:hypothetical protein